MSEDKVNVEYFVEETLDPNGKDTGLRSRAPIGWSIGLGIVSLAALTRAFLRVLFKSQAKGSNCLIKGIV